MLNQIEETRKALAALSTGTGDEGVDLNEAINAAVNNALTVPTVCWKHSRKSCRPNLTR